MGIGNMKDEPYIPKTEEEIAEAYKLLDDLLREMAKRQAFEKVMGEYLSNTQESEDN
jgi:hypothetical protein